MVWWTAPINSVYPSGAARAASAAPTVPPAPGRLSMMTCCPQAAVSFCPTMRARKSVEPPGGKGTMTRMVLLGYACASAPPAGVTSKAAMNTSLVKLDREFIFVFPCLRGLPGGEVLGVLRSRMNLLSGSPRRDPTPVYSSRDPAREVRRRRGERTPAV